MQDTIKAGDRVEYANYASKRNGEVATVVLVDGKKSVVRFADGSEWSIHTSRLSWLPPDLEAAKDKLFREHLAAKRREPGA
jgi:hypothetical protein